MSKIDRIILIVLALGVWCLIFLLPSPTTAHTDNSHYCDGYIGELVEGGHVSVECSHYRRN